MRMSSNVCKACPVLRDCVACPARGGQQSWFPPRSFSMTSGGSMCSLSFLMIRLFGLSLLPGRFWQQLVVCRLKIKIKACLVGKWEKKRCLFMCPRAGVGLWVPERPASLSPCPVSKSLTFPCCDLFLGLSWPLCTSSPQADPSS